MNRRRTARIVTKLFHATGGAGFFALGLATTNPAHAVERSWNAGVGSWGHSANWSPAAVPTASDIVRLNYLVNGTRGIATVSGEGFATPVSVSMRQSNELRIAKLSSLSVGGDMIVGYGNSVGYLAVNSSSPGIVVYDGRLTIGNTLRLGYESSLGIVNQNDGIVTVNQLVRVGDRHAISPIFPGTGRYNLSGVGLLDAARLEIGYGGDNGEFACEGEFNLSGDARLNIGIGAQLPEPRIGGGGGVGVLNQSGGILNSPFRIIDMARGGGSGVYNYSGGGVSIAGMAFSNNDGAVNYTGGANLSLGQLQMTGGGQVRLTAGNDKTLRTSLLWMANNQAVIDLNDNAMATFSVLETLGGQSLQTLLSRGYNGGAWTGNGLTSSAARDNPQHNTGLGYALASEVLTPIRGGGAGSYIYRGQIVEPNSTLIDYTYYGDANLDGTVDFDDYVRTDLGYNTGATGWVNGDFNYSGQVNFDDYVLIDVSFNTQAGTLSRAIDYLSGDDRSKSGRAADGVRMAIEHFEQFGTPYARAFLSAVPEPGGIMGAILSGAWLTQRRRRERGARQRGLNND